MMESSKIMHEKGLEEFEEYATIGKWRVIKDFTVVPIAYHAEFLNNDAELRNLHDAYLKFIGAYPEKKKDFTKICDYIAGEFARVVSNDERYKYKITGAFSQILYSMGAEGIIYPSAKEDTKGYNIALPPNTVDTCLKLEKVAVFRIKKRVEGFISPFLYCDKFQQDGKFIWEEANMHIPPYYIEKRLAGTK